MFKVSGYNDKFETTLNFKQIIKWIQKSFKKSTKNRN
jgi:predicted ATP-binding protein involved in virulence